MTLDQLVKNYSMSQVESLYRQGAICQETYEHYCTMWENSTVRYSDAYKAYSNEWVRDAIASGWWDDPETLRGYLDDLQHDLAIELESPYPVLSVRDGLPEAIAIISSQLATLGK